MKSLDQITPGFWHFKSGQAHRPRSIVEVIKRRSFHVDVPDKLVVQFFGSDVEWELSRMDPELFISPIGDSNQQEKLEVAREALRWYANPEHWVARNADDRTKWHQCAENAGSMERLNMQCGTITKRDGMIHAMFNPDHGYQAKQALHKISKL